MTREEINDKAIKLSDKHDNVLLEFSTGVGKTKASLDIINNNDSTTKWLIILSEVAHIENWKKDIIKHNYQKLLPQIQFVLYASLHKYANKSFYGIILDEAHHCQTDKRVSALKAVERVKTIMLTATITKREKEILEKSIGIIYTFKFSLSDAINANILPTPKIVLIPLELNCISTNQEIIINKGTATLAVTVHCSFKNRFIELSKYKNVKLIVKCTELEKYNYLCEKITYYESLFYKTRQEFNKQKWLQAATQRKRFLSSIKTTHVKTLLNTINSRYICFAGSIEQCNELGGKNIIHSKSTGKTDVIHKFNSGKIDSLFAVGMLREGVNLVDSDAIITQLDSKSRSTVQMVGRALRKQSPVIHIFYYKNTQDEIYMNNSLEEFKEFVVKQ